MFMAIMKSILVNLFVSLFDVITLKCSCLLKLICVFIT